jgi:hypothetical protein
MLNIAKKVQVSDTTMFPKKQMPATKIFLQKINLP